jgi:hypothetical protein
MEMNLAVIMEWAVCLAVWLGTAVMIEGLLGRVCPYGPAWRALLSAPLSVLLLATLAVLISTLLRL